MDKISGKSGALIREQAEQARLSRRLVDLHQPIPLTCDIHACRLPDFSSPRLAEFLLEQGFRSLLKELQPATATVDTSKREYAILGTKKELADWLKQAEGSPYLVLDAETDGLESRHCGLVGLSLAYRQGAAAYVPVAHQDLNCPSQLSLEEASSALNAFFQKSKAKLVGHNLKFDVMCLSRHGVELPPASFDTMVAAYVLNPSRNGYGLKDLAFDILGEMMTSIDQLIGKGSKQKTMAEVAVSEAAPYACADADMTYRLFKHFETELKKNGLERLFYEMEMPLVAILADMEVAGIRVDQKHLATLAEDLEKRLSRIEKEIHQMAGEPFNLNSPKQLATILFEKLKLPPGRKTKTGFSTDEDVLTALAKSHELPSRLMQYRELQKLQSTYVVGLREAVDPADGRVHSHFNQTVASTGRLSSTDPNLQNIPIRTETGRQIREAFVAEEDHVLLSADYSQIDLRMLAHISGDSVLKEAFQKGEDVHTTTACHIFNVTPDGVTSDLRRIAKSINFGIVYGISPFGLSQQLGIPMDEAKAHIERYFARYAGVRAWMDRCLREARETGSVRTLLGRIRYLPDIQAKNPNIRGFSERMALNTPIQGTSADVIKMAMIHVDQAFHKKQWRGRMLLQVHDELVFEIPEKDLEASAFVIKPLMENAVPLSIPVVVDLKTGKNWAHMKPGLHV